MKYLILIISIFCTTSQACVSEEGRLSAVKEIKLDLVDAVFVANEVSLSALDVAPVRTDQQPEYLFMEFIKVKFKIENVVLGNPFNSYFAFECFGPINDNTSYIFFAKNTRILFFIENTQGNIQELNKIMSSIRATQNSN